MTPTSRRVRDAPSSPLPGKIMWPTLLVLILIVLVFAGMRVAVDGPNVAAGIVPPEGAYERRFALHPLLTYAHILPGVIYLVGAPFQLWRGFRERHFSAHRRMGRIVLPAGILAGIFAIIFGILFSFGGLLEASATVVFGGYFVSALVIAFLAIRGGDVTRHRRWMIRAFAIGVGVGTIRIWIGVFQGFGLLSLDRSFGVAFWLAFVLHALVAEVYLAKRPSAQGSPAPAATREVRLSGS